MDRIRNRYNPDYFYDKSLARLDLVSKGEALSWYNHNCTQALLNSLEGDLAGIVVSWLGGGYSEEESSSGTAQKQAKARGMAQAIDDVIEHVNEIKNLKLEGESSNERFEHEASRLQDLS
jgi:hypothetical protein